MNNPMRTLLAVFTIALFTGCGQMGPLYNPAPEVDTSSPENTTVDESAAENQPLPESTDSEAENNGV